ncbi:hypothetical protein ACCE29_002586, partial [Salmonella enterica]|nr:hypothetical protein [Salmonella enterica subsp. enterica serovar Norwich]EFS6681003.1 hypothetical protein [Salmonella enterica]EFT6556578.1 hypothetical protein [Salmonella enterica subsp. enterica serovar Norwich]EGC0677340.1 hypothetical protein [Salmonella enterica]EGF2395346.1 hypothetical protein [Salmonella enterica]
AVKRALNAVQKNGDTMTGNLTLKSDDRVHFIIQNADGSVRAYIYKDKGGDGIRINNGADGGGEFVFGKSGEFYSPGYVYAGAARLAIDGNVWGTRWNANGAWLWDSIAEQLTIRDNNTNTRATWDWVNQNFVSDITLGQEGVYCPVSNVVSWTFKTPAGCMLTGIIVQDTGSHSADNIGGVYYKPIQKKVNGAVMTIAG